MAAARNQVNTGAGGPYQVPPEPNRWPAIGLAVGVHALLLAFLWIGVSWQNHTPVAVEAEVWDTQVQSAAPPPPPPPPQETKEPEPEPAPPKPREIAPPPVTAPAPPKLPDIALEREKKRKEDLARKKEAERVEREEQRERELAQQREDEKKAKAAEEKKLREQEKKEKELAKKEEEKKKAEKEKAAKEKADKLAKEKEAKETKAKAAAEQAKLDKLRDADLKRMLGGAGTSGTAEKSTGPRGDKGYEAAIQAKVKGNTSFGGDEPGNPTVTFQVSQLPTGDIVSVKKIKSSGVPAFDDAVEKGINKSSPLPKRKDGTVERTLVIEFKLKDMQ